jgi:hypothetical protein
MSPDIFKSICSVFLALCFAFSVPLVSGQESGGFGGRRGISVDLGYAPTSEHILIGRAQERETVQGGLGYSRALKRWSNISVQYEGSIQPFYVERDPTFLGTSTPNPEGPPTIAMFSSPYRPIGLYGDFGYVYVGNGQSDPVLGIPGPRENTYAFAALPFGLRLSGFTRRRIQPTIAIDLGALYATRNIPVEYTSSFNFLAYAGPGVELFLGRRRSIRLEYLYQHLSNAGLGAENPGVDSGGYRVTLTRYR